jgi:predicted O-methyltransferase YrrM
MTEAFMLFTALLLLAFIAHKVRRIHQATFRIEAAAGRAAREAEVTYGQIQAYLSLERLLSLPYPLPPLRGWAGSPDFLLLLARTALADKPAVVVECSSGASTVVLARALQMSGTGHVYSLEHDPVFAQKTRDLLAQQGLSSWADVIDAPLTPWPEFEGRSWYALDGLASLQGAVEMLVIDGPPTATGPCARHPAVPALASRLKVGARVFLDDADRDEEREAVQRWTESGYVRDLEYLSAEKGCAKFTFSMHAGEPSGGHRS